jgi:carboxylesterase
MPNYPPPTPDPFDYPGNDVGILLVHGFTGSPSETRPLGQYLAQQGYTVAGLLLPGHGTTWQDLNKCKWQDWAGAVEQAYLKLKDRCRQAFVVGVSLGGLLTLHLAERHPEIPAIVTMAPGLIAADWRSNWVWLAKYFIQFVPYDPARDGDDLTDPEVRQRDLWSYRGTPVAASEQVLKLQRAVRPNLSKIAMPILLFHGLHDRTVKTASSQYVYDHVTSKNKELIWLSNSGHCLWVDAEKERVWQKTHQFIAQHTAA